MSDIQEEQKRLYKRAEENDIELLQEENKKLKDLCNKYEEEHKTTFEEWKKDINIIDELEKYLNEELENYTIEIENKNKGKLGYTLPIKGEIKNILDKLNELKGDNK